MIRHDRDIVVGIFSVLSCLLLPFRFIDFGYRCACWQFWIFNNLIVDNLFQSDVIDMSGVSTFLRLKNNLLALIKLFLYSYVAESKIGIS